MAKHKHGEIRDGVLLVDEELICDYEDADKLRGLSYARFKLVNERKPFDAVSNYLREQVLAPGLVHAQQVGEVMAHETKADTADIFADAQSAETEASDEAVSESMFDKPKRERTKDTSPMAQAKLATTQLRVLDARKGRALLAADKLRSEVEKLDAQRDQFILTLDDKVIAILKAGGVL